MTQTKLEQIISQIIDSAEECKKKNQRIYEMLFLDNKGMKKFYIGMTKSHEIKT